MGVDFLDLNFRLAKSFGIRIANGDYDRVFRPDPQHLPDLTAGMLHDFVVTLCREQNVPVPHSSWTRVRLPVAHVVRRPPGDVHRQTRLVKDLGFS